MKLVTEKRLGTLNSEREKKFSKEFDDFIKKIDEMGIKTKKSRVSLLFKKISNSWVIPEVARSALSIKGNVGEVTLFDLLKSSLRQRPDYIVMGEVRGKEAFVLFQQMATGHPSLATIHAASIGQLNDRLTTPPISLPPTLIENINIVVFLVMSRYRGKYVRRADSILEIRGMDGIKPKTSDVFKWNPMKDNFNVRSDSSVLSAIALKQGMTDEMIGEELVRRRAILEWMVEQEIYDYREISKIISSYYSDPERIMSYVRESG